MKKLYALLILATLVCALAMPALAAPGIAGASHEEIGLYNTPGAATQGMPAFAKDTLGEERGDAFVAAAEASAPAIIWGSEIFTAQETAPQGLAHPNLISLTLDRSQIGTYNGEVVFEYYYDIAFRLATQENANVYFQFGTDGWREQINVVAKGSGEWSTANALGDVEFDENNKEIFVRVVMESDDGRVLAASNLVSLPNLSK